MTVEPEHLTRLLDEHAPALTLYARQWCDAPADAVQDAFLRLVALPTVPDDIVCWLYRVVRNSAISAARAASRRSRHERQPRHHIRLWFEEDPASAIDAATATRALGALPPELREVIVLRLWGSLSFAEIAELTNTSTSTVHRRYISGPDLLRQREESCQVRLSPKI